MSKGMTNAAQKTEYTAGSGISISENTISAPYAPTTAGEEGQVWTSNGEGGGKWADNVSEHESKIFPITSKNSALYSGAALYPVPTSSANLIKEGSVSGIVLDLGDYTFKSIKTLYISQPTDTENAAEVRLINNGCALSNKKLKSMISQGTNLYSIDLPDSYITNAVTASCNGIDMYGCSTVADFTAIIYIGLASYDARTSRCYSIQYNDVLPYFEVQFSIRFYPNSSKELISISHQKHTLYYVGDSDPYIGIVPTSCSLFP